MLIYCQQGFRGLCTKARKPVMLQNASRKPCCVDQAVTRPFQRQKCVIRSYKAAEAVLSPAWTFPALAVGACATWLSSATAAYAAVEPFSGLLSQQQLVQQAQQQQHVQLQALGGTSVAPSLQDNNPQQLLSQQYNPSLLNNNNQQQQQQQQPQEMSLLATVGEPRHPHWLIEVLGIGVVNILGLWAVLQVLKWNKDSSTPVTVMRLHMGLRVENNELQERLRFLRSMMGVEHAMFFTMEEAIQAVCQPPRGTELAFADLSVTPLNSKHEGYEVFKQRAAVEVAAAAQEEAGHVLHDGAPHPECRHRTPLERLMGAEATQDLDQCTSCVMVTLVMLAKGRVSMPETAIQDVASFKGAMKQLCGGLRSGQLLAVELLLTPDNPADFLSEANMLEDYPFMIDLASGKSAAEIRGAARPSSMEDATGTAAAPAGI